jgi:SAM-dependent methyltransferase
MAEPQLTTYHLSELRIARDPSAKGHLLPAPPPQCRSVLDVGCGAGQTLLGLNLPAEALACGVDPDVAALRLGRTLDRQISLVAATAEQLPLPSESFDFVFSRVALPYTNIPRAVRELTRVLRAGGQIWLALHPVAMGLRDLRVALTRGRVKRAVHCAYVLVNGALLHVVGKQFPFPVGGRYESVQTRRGMIRVLGDAGLTDVHVRQDEFFVVTARKQVL